VFSRLVESTRCGLRPRVILVVLRGAAGRAFEHDGAFSIVAGEGGCSQELVLSLLVVAFAAAAIALALTALSIVPDAIADATRRMDRAQ